ncbi:MAG TPA: adenosylhopane nucleosidase [Roseiarcus sp.]|nr:adenosylhopane nucleosidase [Roseiarcus sp.]
MFIGNHIGEETTAGATRDAYAAGEAEPSLVADADSRRFNWRELWPISHRLRSYLDGKIWPDWEPAWRWPDFFAEGGREASLWRPAPPSSDILAIVGLQFEARILASRSIRAVFLRPDPNLLSANIIAANRGIISFGICGGLAPGLRAGACIIASSIHDGARIWRTNEEWTRRLLQSIPGAIVAPILGVDAPVIHIAEKSRLYERFGAAVVDMESHLAAAAASAHRLPLAAVRVVADDARCGLPDAALAGRRVDGSIDAPAVLRALLDNPSDLAPLIRLAAQTHLARAKLLSLSQSLGGRMGLPFP